MHPRRGGRPKIAELLGRPSGALALQQLTAARNLNIAPTLFVGLRLPTTEYVFGDPDNPDKVTGTVSSPAYTPEDQGLLMALLAYEDSLCRCGQPRAVAWHWEMDGWYEADEFVCHACTAASPDDKPVTYSQVRDTRPPSKGPLPLFVLGKTTTAPTP